MTSPIEIRERALEIAKLCRELDQILENEQGEINVLLPWNWIEQPGDDIFGDLADEIENRQGIEI
jgi:hypothetical protein